MARSPLLPLVALLLSACHGGGGAAPGPLADWPEVGATPGPITEPTAVLFWLPRTDTLSPEERQSAVQGITMAAEVLRSLLGAYGIAVTGESTTTIRIAISGGPERTVMLEGLDYPWGVVFVDPGYPEQILTGPVDAADLEDLAWDYFLLEEGTRGPARAAVQAARRFRQNQYAGSPAATTPRPMAVSRGGWLAIVLRTMAAAERTKRAGVQG